MEKTASKKFPVTEKNGIFFNGNNNIKNPRVRDWRRISSLGCHQPFGRLRQ